MSFLFKKKKKGPKTRDLSPIQKLAKNSSNLANTITTSLTSLNKKETGEGNYPALESDKKLEDDFGVQPREEFKNSPPLTREAKTYNEAYVGNDSPQMPPSGSGEPTFSPKSPKRRSVNFDHSFEVDDINRRRSVDSTRSNQSYDFDQLDKSTQKLINKLKFEISELQDENISLKTDYQCAIENYEAQISELTEENTRLKTQVNSVVRRDRDRTTGSLGLTSPASSLSPEHKNYANLEESTGGLEAGNVLNSSEPTGTRSSGHHSASHTNQLQPSSEQFNNIIKMLEHQINELLQEKYDQKINQAIRNFSDTPSKLKHLIPNWVINFDDMGPLVRSYDARLKKAFALLKVHEDKYQRDRDQVIPALNLEIEGLKRNNSKLQNHLVEMGNKLQVQEQEMERKNREQESTGGDLG